jgi:hypothetical protein
MMCDITLLTSLVEDWGCLTLCIVGLTTSCLVGLGFVVYVGVTRNAWWDPFATPQQASMGSCSCSITHRL